MVYTASFESCEPKRFVRCWKKVERKYIQEQQPNQFHSYNQNMGFASRMDQNVVKFSIGTQMKKCWWSSFVSVMDIVLQGVCLLYHSNKYEGDESLPFPAFRRDVVSAIF